MSEIQKSKKRNRNILQRFFVTQEEVNQIYNRMQLVGISTKSAYYRQMALHGYIVHWDFQGLHQLLYEVNKIGQNLNQIAKHANLYGDIPKGVLEEISENLDKVVKHYCDNIPRATKGKKESNAPANNS